jgi:hypothetical protein
MSSGFGLLGLDPQALQQTPQSPQGIPAGIDQGLQTAGLPSMSSVLNGMMNGATGDAQAIGDMGGRIGSLLSGMVGRTGDLMEKFRSGQIGAGEFLQGAAQRAGQAAMSGPNFTQKFLAGQVDPSSEEAAVGGLGAAGYAMTGGLAGAPVRNGEAILGAGPIRAYHGSPHDFERFDLSKIGTGEGAQSQGAGLYFTDSQRLASAYRKPDLMNAEHQRGTGHMYEVELAADPEHFLAWDKPHAEQSPAVQAALATRGISDGASGQEIYNAVGGPQALKEAGIPGTTYGRDGNRGYVTFSDDIVSILRKYGLAGLLGGGAAAGALNQDKNGSGL